MESPLHIYVTVNMCNQGIRAFTENFREYAYSLITYIHCNIYTWNRVLHARSQKSFYFINFLLAGVLNARK